jgi:phage gp29-like protein
MTEVYAPKLSLLERPAPPADRPLSPRARSLDIYDRWAPHPGHGLTPLRLSGILKTADYGWPQEQCDLFDDIIERDAHLRAQLEHRAEAVLSKDWIIQAGGEGKDDIRAAKLLEERLRDVQNFPEMIEHQLTASTYGYAASEIHWELVAGVVAPVWFGNVPPRRFVFDAHGSPRLLTRNDSTEGVALDPGQWLISSRRHRQMVQAGNMRTACWWSLFKSMAVRDWVNFAERFGLPLPIGRYRDDMPEEERKILRQAVEMLGRDGYAIFSDGGLIEFAKVEYGGSSDVHPALATFCNAEISKLVTGATLTSGEGTSTGSYALGKVHENVAFTISLGDSRRLGDGVANFLGRPFVHFNGLSCRPPRLRIHVVRELEPAARMDVMVKALNELKLPLDVDQVRQEHQLKAPVGNALAPPVPPPSPPPGLGRPAAMPEAPVP